MATMDFIKVRPNSLRITIVVFKLCSASSSFSSSNSLRITIVVFKYIFSKLIICKSACLRITIVVFKLWCVSVSNKRLSLFKNNNSCI